MINKERKNIKKNKFYYNLKQIIIIKHNSKKL